MYIHTFEVTYELPKKKSKAIQEDLRKDKSCWKAEDNGMLYFGLSNKGILIRTFLINKKNYHTYQVQYIISAERVMNNDNYVRLFNTRNYSDLFDKVNALLKAKSEALPKVNKCKLSRLDFCVNAVLDNQSQVKAYINTMRRGKAPRNMKRFEMYDIFSKRVKPTKDDMTVHSKKSFDNVEISIYNKYAQMKKEKENTYSNENLEEAKNIVRIEIRCKKEKIKELKKKYKLDSLSAFFNRANKIGSELFNYYLPQIASNATIRTLKDSEERIAKSEYGKKTKKLLWDFVEHANTVRSVSKAIENFNKYHSKKKINEMLLLLNDIDVNPITVTKEDLKKFDCGYIPSLIELYKEFSK